MFGSYTEVVAYVHECEQSDIGVPIFPINGMQHSIICADIMSSASSFGGFKTWPNDHIDFILIAECSEICGPNPLFTIPSQQHIDINLNLLAIQILSVDYQGLGSDKNIPMKHTQLLIPDIMSDVHVAVNHFVLFDSEARGFIRPFCVAYVTADKHKLIEFADPILKGLAEASSFIQHSNTKFCSEKLQNLVLDLQFTKSVIPSGCNSDITDIEQCLSAEQKIKFYDDLIESCLEDIYDILNTMQHFKDQNDAGKLIDDFIQRLSKNTFTEEVLSFVNKFADEDVVHEPQFMKLPMQHDFDKQLEHLLVVSPRGVLLGIYHLYIMHKHFRRKYENIAMHSDVLCKSHKGNHLHFGACVVYSTRNTEGFGGSGKKCYITLPIIPSTLSSCDNSYFNCVDTEFCEVILDFLKSKDYAPNSITESDAEALNLHLLKIDSTSSGSEENFSSVHESCIQDEELELGSISNCHRHIVKLSDIWDISDNLKYNSPEVESVILEVLQICNKTESTLFSLLTHVTIVIAYSLEDDFFVRTFVTALAALVPRSKKKEMFVEHDRKVPLEKKDLTTLAAVTFCLPVQFNLSNFIAPELLPFVSILNLKENTYSGPKYMGCLLGGMDEKIRHMSLQDPIIPVLISILAEIEMQVKLWQSVVSSSMNSTVATHYMLKKGFTSCDIKIVEKLSQLSEN